MVGQLVSVTICEGNESRFFVENSDTNTEPEFFTTTEDEEYTTDGGGAMSDSLANNLNNNKSNANRPESPELKDVIVGRVYSYDYLVKLLILKTVVNAGTAEETFADSVMINARNIKHIELLEPLNQQKDQNEDEVDEDS